MGKFLPVACLEKRPTTLPDDPHISPISGFCVGSFTCARPLSDSSFPSTVNFQGAGFNILLGVQRSQESVLTALHYSQGGLDRAIHPLTPTFPYLPSAFLLATITPRPHSALPLMQLPPQPGGAVTNLPLIGSPPSSCTCACSSFIHRRPWTLHFEGPRRSQFIISLYGVDRDT